MGIAHLAAGLAAKPVAPKASLGVLLLASEAIDILWIALFLAGIENFRSSPWSHGLFMSVVWSLLAALLAWRFYRDFQTGAVIGLVVLSHWVLDFISHPMGALGMGHQPDLPLFFAGSPKVGLGVYNSVVGMVAGELILLSLGLLIYLNARKKIAAPRLSSDKGTHLN